MNELERLELELDLAKKFLEWEKISKFNLTSDDAVSMAKSAIAAYLKRVERQEADENAKKNFNSRFNTF